MIMKLLICLVLMACGVVLIIRPEWVWRIFYSLFYGEPPEDLGVWRALGTFVFLLGALILIVYVLLPALGL